MAHQMGFPGPGQMLVPESSHVFLPQRTLTIKPNTVVLDTIWCVWRCVPVILATRVQ
jgi:hypothetical protein